MTNANTLEPKFWNRGSRRSTLAFPVLMLLQGSVCQVILEWDSGGEGWMKGRRAQGWLKILQDLAGAHCRRGGTNCVCLEERWGVGAERLPAGEQASWQTPQFPELIPAPCHCSQFCCFNNIIFIHPTERRCLGGGRGGRDRTRGTRGWGGEAGEPRKPRVWNQQRVDLGRSLLRAIPEPRSPDDKDKYIKILASEKNAGQGEHFIICNNSSRLGKGLETKTLDPWELVIGPPAPSGDTIHLLAARLAPTLAPVFTRPGISLNELCPRVWWCPQCLALVLV